MRTKMFYIFLIVTLILSSGNLPPEKEPKPGGTIPPTVFGGTVPQPFYEIFLPLVGR